MNVSHSLPQSTLDPSIFASYFPLVMKEVEKEFAHQSDGRTNRKTREYGYSFFRLCKNDFTYEVPPQFLLELGSHLCKSLGHEARSFNNIILSYYDQRYVLEPHIDTDKSMHQKTKYHFDENVYGLVVEPDSTGHLYFVRHESAEPPPLNLPPIYALSEKAGLVFSLQGPLRHAPYHHGVTQVANRRITLTYRTVLRE